MLIDVKGDDYVSPKTRQKMKKMQESGKGATITPHTDQPTIIKKRDNNNRS